MKRSKISHGSFCQAALHQQCILKLVMISSGDYSSDTWDNYCLLIAGGCRIHLMLFFFMLPRCLSELIPFTCVQPSTFSFHVPIRMSFKYCYCICCFFRQLIPFTHQLLLNKSPSFLKPMPSNFRIPYPGKMTDHPPCQNCHDFVSLWAPLTLPPPPTITTTNNLLCSKERNPSQSSLPLSVRSLAVHVLVNLFCILCSLSSLCRLSPDELSWPTC